MKKVYLSIIFLFFVQSIFAQDAPFSQTALSISMRNPASVGLISNQYQLTASYRSQWAALPSPYQNISASFEQKLSDFSFGISLLKINARSTSIQQTDIQLKVAYQKALAQKDHSIHIGLAIGAIQQQFTPNSFLLDNQFQGELVFNNPSSNPNKIENTSLLLPDITAGLIWENTIGKIKNEVGISIAHINQPVASFYSKKDKVYPICSFLHIRSSLPINKRWSIKAHIQYMKQANANGPLFGAGAQYQINQNKYWHVEISSRKGDALILATGIHLKNVAFDISYDLYQPKLADAINGNGGFEFSASYYFNKK